MKSSGFIALRFRNVRLLMLSLLIAQGSNQMLTVAINWHMYLLTHSALSLGLLGLVGFFPILIFSLISGTIVDKIDRKKILTMAQIIYGISAFCLLFTTVLQHATSVLLYIFVAINAVSATFSVPSRQSLLPAIVPEKYFLNVVTINNLIWELAVMLGPTLAGIFIGFKGVQLVYLISAIGFLAASVATSSLQISPKQEKKEVTVGFSGILEGLLFVIKSPLIYSTMLLDFFATFFASANTLMPIFAKDIFHVGPQGLGFLYSAPAVGAVIMGLFISRKHTIKNQGQVLLIAIFFFGLATIGFGLSRIFVLSLIFLSITGASDTVSAVIRNTIRQLKTPDHLRGRMTAINMNFFIGGPYLGETEAGIAAAALGVPISVALGGVATIGLSLFVMLLVPRLRKYKGDELPI